MESAVERPRVLILDEDRFFSEGLRRMLEADGIPVLSEFADGVDRAASAVEAAPDLVVLGVGSTAGGKALAGISRDAPSARIVVVGVSEERVEILELLAAGAASRISLRP
jgi:DNA-binding NarL/FixJ family response regulator